MPKEFDACCCGLKQPLDAQGHDKPKPLRSNYEKLSLWKAPPCPTARSTRSGSKTKRTAGSRETTAALTSATQKELPRNPMSGR
jgi:hypothetical protein